MPLREVRKLWTLWAALALAASGAGVWLLRNQQAPEPEPPTEYASAESCRTCHAAIHATYQKVGMARSFYVPTPGTVGADLSGSRFYHEPSSRYYEMLWRDGKLYQRRFQIDRQGRRINEFEQQAHFVVGSGNHARTFLHQSAHGEITELPLSWYAKESKWGMSPGYDKPKHFDFTRRIDHGCMFCHNAYPPNIEPGADRFGTVASFPADLPRGIDCQRCHGPGARHVTLAASGKAASAAVRAAIVNPARLTPDLQMDLCMQCHLETTSAPLPQGTRRFGRGVYSYRPGQPLGDYMIYFDHAPGAGYDDKFEIVSAAYRLRKSECFLESEGRLTCITCHNPHDVPRGEEAVAHYRQRCVGCHAQLPGATHPKPGASDCAACHMPKRRTEDAVQVVMTDHFIQRKPATRNLLAPLKEKEVAYRGDLAIYYPDRLSAADREAYLGIALVAHGADRARGIAMLERVTREGAMRSAKLKVELADAYMAEGRTNDAIVAYRAALEADPGLAKARYNLAQALERSGDLNEAERQYEQLTGARAGFAEAHFSLANLLARTGRADRARAAFETSLRIRPIYVEPRNNLATLYMAQGNAAQARLELQEALKIDPDSAEALNNLAKLSAAQGQQAEALELVSRAASLEPEDAGIRLNLSRLLLMAGSVQRAIRELNRIVKEKPEFAEAHLTLGIAYGESGQMDAAIREFRQVLRLQPNHPDAQRNLELALQPGSNR